jgi:hypothetical protein
VEILGNITTEIRSFNSIKEITEVLDGELEQYRSMAEEYSQWLGSLMRDSEGLKKNDEQIRELKALQKGKQKEKSKKGKSKSRKKLGSNNWVQFKDIVLSASELSEAEILFEAVESITEKISHLEKVKSSVEQLENSRLGNELIYIIYINNGVPEKIVLRHRQDRDFANKFQYIADFSLVKEI